MPRDFSRVHTTQSIRSHRQQSPEIEIALYWSPPPPHLINSQCSQSRYYIKPGSHMSAMIDEPLSVIIQGENSQRILLMSNH